MRGTPRHWPAELNWLELQESLGRDPSKELCKCGRSLSRPHCPMCGALSISASIGEVVDHPLTSEPIFVSLYKCRICGNRFNMLEASLECRAQIPQKSSNKKAIREATKSLRAEGEFINRINSGDKEAGQALLRKAMERRRARGEETYGFFEREENKDSSVETSKEGEETGINKSGDDSNSPEGAKEIK